MNGKNVKYHVSFNTHFPETLPPEEDIMYFELFNFFNDLIASEEGWEDVVGENLPDPRDNPAYYERTVTWFGKEVRLVPGTGIYYEDGTRAEIDYEGKDWWVEEGFLGGWTLDIDRTEDVSSASFKVNEDGSVSLTVDGGDYEGRLSDVRRYNCDVDVDFEIEGRERGGTIILLKNESYEDIRVECFPLPVPETQFDPIDVYLIKK